MFQFLIEDMEAKKDYEEALKIVEKLQEKYGYNKLNSPLVFFRLASMANTFSLNELIN